MKKFIFICTLFFMLVAFTGCESKNFYSKKNVVATMVRSEKTNAYMYGETYDPANYYVYVLYNDKEYKVNNPA